MKEFTHASSQQIQDWLPFELVCDGEVIAIVEHPENCNVEHPIDKHNQLVEQARGPIPLRSVADAEKWASSRSYSREKQAGKR